MNKFQALLASSAIVLGTAISAKGDDGAKLDVLLRRLDSMEKEIKDLKGQLAAQKQPEKDQTSPTRAENAQAPQTSLKVANTTSEAPAASGVTNLNGELEPANFGMAERSTDALRLGAYGEVRFGKQETESGWKNGFDASRVVLLGTYAFTDNIIFNTELEFEHGGIAKDEDDKLDGAVEVEQAFVDFKVNDYFNWRAPGVDIVPVGYTGLFHEPTQYYSVDRPEIYQGLIPSTWFEGASSIYGKVVDDVSYQVQVSTGLEDAGTTAPDSDGNVPDGGYEAGISGTEALGLSRASISDRKQLGNNLGYAGRLAYTPSVIPGLGGSTSVYYTSNTTPRAGYGTLEDESTFLLGKSSLTMVDTELRYRVPSTGLELRAEYAEVFFSDPNNLRANNDTDPENNVGDDMYAYSFEGAYHLDLEVIHASGWELVPFYRYTYLDLQNSGFEGSDANDPTGAGEQQYHTFGVALFPTPKLVLKLDYQMVQDDAEDSPKSDHFLGAVGYLF